MQKRVLSLIVTLCMLMSVFSAFPISVSAASTPSDWALAEVNAAINEGLVTDKVTKNYQKAITREEFCELVVKLYEKLTSEKATIGNNPFSDTDNTEILKAYSLGIVNGVSETEFAPDNTITRQEMCVMIVRAIESILGDEFILKYDFYKFEDSRYIADWAFEQVYYAYEKGIVKGVGNNQFSPLGTATCEQAILMVYRLHENIDKCRDTIPQEVIDGYENYTYVNETFKEIEKKYIDENGYVIPEKVSDLLNAVYASAQKMLENGDIHGAQLNVEYLNVCIVLNDGTGYIYSPAIEGLANADPKLAVTEFNNFGAFGVDIFSYVSNKIDNDIKVSSYNSYSHKELGVNTIKQILQKLNSEHKQVIFWRGHGVVWDYSEEKSIHDDWSNMVNSDDKASAFLVTNDSGVLSMYEFYSLIKDRKEKRVILAGDDAVITPRFFEKYLPQVKGGLFFTGSCYGVSDHYGTTSNLKMSDAIRNKGFDTYIGANQSVWSTYSEPMMSTFGKYLCEYTDENKNETLTADEALLKAKEKHGESDWNILTTVMNVFQEDDVTMAQFFLFGEIDFRLIESKTIQSSHIAEYNGITYSTRDVPGMVKIPVQPAKYDYIWEIAFYEDKLYYSCKESGSSDYKSAIYSCNLDGSDLKLLYEGTYESTSFTITGNKLYPSGTSSYGKKYVDIKTSVLKEPNYVISDDYNVFYVSGDYAYCSTYSKKSKYSIYKINVVTGESQSITSNLSKTYECISSSNGDVYYSNKNCLYHIENGESKLIHQFDRNISLVAVIDDIVYYESYQGNTSSLYYYDLSTHSDNIIDSHPSAGGGIYFNW